MAERFDFALNLTTNAPEVVRTIEAALNDLQRRGRVGAQQLVGGDAAAVTRFTDSLVQAANSGKSVNEQLRTIGASFERLGREAPAAAAAFDKASISGIAQTLAVQAGASGQQLNELVQTMSRVSEAARAQTSTSVTGFNQQTSAVEANQRALAESIALTEKLLQLNQSLGAQRTGTPIQQIQASTGVNRFGNIRGTGEIQTALQDALKFDFSPIRKNIESQQKAIQGALAEFQAVGDAAGAQGASRSISRLAGLLGAVDNLTARYSERMTQSVADTSKMTKEVQSLQRAASATPQVLSAASDELRKTIENISRQNVGRSQFGPVSVGIENVKTALEAFDPAVNKTVTALRDSLRQLAQARAEQVQESIRREVGGTTTGISNILRQASQESQTTANALQQTLKRSSGVSREYQRSLEQVNAAARQAELQLASQGRAQLRASVRSGEAATRALDTIENIRRGMSSLTTFRQVESALGRAERAASNYVTRASEQARLAQEAVTSFGQVNTALLTAAQAGRLSVDRLNAQTRAQEAANVATNASVESANKLAAARKVGTARQDQIAAAESLRTREGRRGFSESFVQGFRGAREAPEALGHTARITLLYGIGYRLLGVVQQIFADALTTMTEFEVGLAELGSVLNLGSSAVDDYGQAVIRASAATGAAAEDLLKATQRISVALGGPAVSAPGGLSEEEIVRQGGQLATSLGQLSVVTGRTAEELSGLIIATGSTYDVAGDVAGALGDLDAYITKNFGVPAGDVLKAVGQISELGQAAGFSVEELAAFAAQVQQSTGQTADAVAGYLSQILGRSGEGAVQSRFSDLGIDVTQSFKDQMDQLALLFEQGLISDAIIKDISNAFGRGRVGSAVLAYINNAATIRTQAAGAADSGGALGERFGKREQTLAGSIEILRSQFEALILALAPLSESIANIVKLLTLFLRVLTPIISMFGSVEIAGHSVVAILGTIVLGARVFNHTFNALGGATRLLVAAFRKAAIDIGTAGRLGRPSGVVPGPGGRASGGRVGVATAIGAGARGLALLAGPVGLGVAAVATGISALSRASSEAEKTVAATTDALRDLGDPNNVTQFTAAIDPEKLSADVNTALSQVRQQIEQGVGGFWTDLSAGLFGRRDTENLRGSLDTAESALSYAERLLDADKQAASLISQQGNEVESATEFLLSAGGVGAGGLSSAFETLKNSGASATTVVQAYDAAIQQLNTSIGQSTVEVNEFIAVLAATFANLVTNEDQLEGFRKDIQNAFQREFNPEYEAATDTEKIGLGGVSRDVRQEIDDFVNELSESAGLLEVGLLRVRNAIVNNVVNINDGIDEAELDKLAEKFLQGVGIDLSGLDEYSQEAITSGVKTLIQGQFEGFVKATEDVGDVVVQSVKDIVAVIEEDINSINAQGAPLFTVQGGFSDDVDRVIGRLGEIDRQIAEAAAEGAEGRVTALKEQRQAAAALIQGTLDDSLRLIELEFAGREQTPAAMRAFAQHAERSILAAGGDVNAMLLFLASASKGIVDTAVRSLRAQLGVARDAYESVQAEINRIRGAAEAALAALDAEFATKTHGSSTLRGQHTEDVNQNTRRQIQEYLDSLDPEVKAAFESFNLIEEALTTHDTAIASLPNIVGSEERLRQSRRDAAKENEDTAAQIRAAAAIAAATRTGDPVALATAQLQKARADLETEEKNTVAYYNALAQVYQAQDALADAILQTTATSRRLSSDITNPLEQAQLDLEDARAAVQDARSRGKSENAINILRLDERQAQAALEETKFRQMLSQLDTNRELNRITDRQYLDYLEAERARLAAVAQRTFQQQQQLDEVEKLLKNAANELEGQFNIGDIDLPTVYEVRRSIAERFEGFNTLSAAVDSFLLERSNVRPVGPAPQGQAPGGSSVVNNNINIDGADIGMIRRILVGALGNEQNRVTTGARKF